MPDLKPNMTFTVTLTAQEFRLVSLALSMKLKKKSKESREAAALSVALLRVRSAYLDDLKKVYDGALEKALAEQSSFQQESDPHEQ